MVGLTLAMLGVAAAEKVKLTVGKLTPLDVTATLTLAATWADVRHSIVPDDSDVTLQASVSTVTVELALNP